MAHPLRSARIAPMVLPLMVSMQGGVQADILCTTEGSRAECSNQGVCICKGGVDYCLCECDNGSCRYGPTCQYTVPHCHVTGGGSDAPGYAPGPTAWLALFSGALLCCCAFAMWCCCGGGGPETPGCGEGQAPAHVDAQPAVEMTSAAVPLVSDPQVVVAPFRPVAGVFPASDLAATATVAPPALPPASVEVVPWSSPNPLAGLSPEVLEHAICRVGIVAELARRRLESDGSTQELAVRLHQAMEQEGPNGFGEVLSAAAARELVNKSLPPVAGAAAPAPPAAALPTVASGALAPGGLAAAPAAVAPADTRNGVEVLPWGGNNPLIGLSPENLEFAICRRGIVAELERRGLESDGSTQDLALRLHRTIEEEGPHGYGGVLSAEAAREMVNKTLPPGVGPQFVPPAPAAAGAAGGQAREGAPVDAQPPPQHGPSD